MNGFDLSAALDIRLGSTTVSAVYYGSNIIWPSHDYSQDYLTFEALESGTFTWTGQTSTTIYYSTNNGSSWNELIGSWNSPGSTASINAGDKILFKANFSGSNPGSFGSTGRFNVMGNVMSLQYGDNFTNQTTLTTVIMNLFTNCNKLVNAHNLILPATTLLYGCYDGMFYGCTSLVSAPALPATTLSDLCYDGMFKGCTSLTAAPALPATTLNTYCYCEMFRGCTSLTSAPVLPATTLAYKCYEGMFVNCKSLNNVTCLATDISATDCTYNWVNGVAATGTFTRDQNNTSWTIGTSGIPSGWTVVPPLAHDYSQDYLTFEAIEAGTFTWTNKQSNNSINYSTDNGSTWSTLASGSSTPTIAANSKVLFKASGLTITNMYGIGTFSSSGRFNAMGNTMSLVYGDYFTNQTTMSNYQFRRLFENCSNIVDASNLILPSTTATYSCYNTMFKNCTSLVAAPELPATTLANYCYSNMFNGCTSLTTAPALPAVTLSDSCYSNMFNGCTSLTIAPVLQATTLVYGCYNSMFRNCSSLVSAPELPAATLAQECYYYMFNGCTSLNYIKCLATNISATNCTKSWVVNVASSGTFVKVLGYAGWPSAGTSGNGIPSGWTVQNAS